MTRRSFLKGAAAAAAFPLVTVAGTKSSGRVLGANDTIRVAVAGIHGRGKDHIAELLGLKDEKLQIVTLIDPDSSLFEARQKAIRDKTGKEPAGVQDVRQALEDKNIDAITIATPNHWHSLMTVWACQAGKDVYVEKPLSHEVSEGRRCVEAARRYKCMVQHGTQQRSSASRAAEIAAVQSGKYGKLLVSKGYCCKPRWSIGTKPAGQPPKTLDFDVWLGPAAPQPYHANLVHYNWHWFWDFGNGDIGNQGVHEMDVARWAIKGATLPSKVWSLGGRFAYDDQGQTPNTELGVMEFGDVLLVFEVCGLVKDKEHANGIPFNVQNEFYTTEGRIAHERVPEGGRKPSRAMFYPKNGGDPEPVKGPEVKVSPGGPFASWLHALRSRRVEDLNADVEVGHYSAALCHLPNISYRLGEKVPFDKKTGRLGDNREVVQSFENLRQNLKAVGVKLDETEYVLGKVLTLDAKEERFTGEGAAEANALLTRAYRKPFAMPERV
jgi:predicted dehydrogenase